MGWSLQTPSAAEGASLSTAVQLAWAQSQGSFGRAARPLGEAGHAACPLLLPATSSEPQQRGNVLCARGAEPTVTAPQGKR